MYTIRKLLEFECAHQLTKAKSHLCNETIHGHSYKVELFFQRYDGGVHPETNMVVDFGSLKIIKQNITDWYDHALIVTGEDQDYVEMLRSRNIRFITQEEEPTAEGMAFDIFTMIEDHIGELQGLKGVRIAKVRVHETRTGYAEYSRG